MIDRRELLELADSLGLRANIVEKDYVLGWVLAGIYHDPVLAASWVFKGGTCLKKCYFETYRFSEDLDFTITEEAHFDQAFLIERFSAIGAWLEEQTGIALPADLLRFDIYLNAREKPAGEGRVAYRGPIAPRNTNLPRIKLDLTFDEKLVLPPSTRPIAHAYSDRVEAVMQARCYAYPEVFGEKVRALSERARPRDLYDVINLFRNGEFTAAAAVIHDVVRHKCSFKGIPFPTLQALNAFKDELAADWSRMLAHQLPQLPPLDSFWDALPEFFRWLEGTEERIRVVRYPLGVGEAVIRGPAGGLAIPYRASSHMEIVRFAAANRLCVDLDYEDERGNRRQRLIEPYSLRSTVDDNYILGAVNIERNKWRSYRLDRIRGVRVANRTFVPRYEIELTPTGIMSAPPVPRIAPAASLHGLGGMHRRASAPLSGARRAGSVYVYRCPICDKKFERKSMDSHLNPHKNKDGWACSGRTGIYETTRY